MTARASALLEATREGTVPRWHGCSRSWKPGGDDARAAIASLPVTVADRAWTVGITGAPGAGKSTLTDHLVAHLRDEGERVAVLAVDPSSPFTGGAILGDRVRMQRHATDPDVFIRSMATRGHLGGLSRVDAAGGPRARRRRVRRGSWWRRSASARWRSTVADAADTTVVVLNPGWGDGVQAAKAGSARGRRRVRGEQGRPRRARRHRARPASMLELSGHGRGCRPSWRPSPPRTGASTTCSAPSAGTTST